MADEQLTERIVGAAIEVHRRMGPGLLESIYERCLGIEIARAGLSVRRQVRVPVAYRGSDLGFGFRLDLLVEERVIVELKTVEAISEIHLAQVLSYLRLTGLETGLIINFRVPALHKGIRRVSLCLD